MQSDYFTLLSARAVEPVVVLLLNGDSVISVCLQEDHFEQLLDTTSEPVLFCFVQQVCLQLLQLCVFAIP